MHICNFMALMKVFQYKVAKVCVLLSAVPEMDEEDCERRRMECLDEMSNLEKQFTDLKDQ